ncbi:MAG: DUF2703 domain-containing protein [Archaeoglobaceae archaeon]|nr:DUF2703 domain-containing protein [Archaeoglobaceae archaeon]MDW8118603.1 DUF2703 domain-containing protein [Archaeoglobaceae archaeon]
MVGCCGRVGNFLLITWRRLMVDGETCQRCSETEKELEKAISVLKMTLEPFGIQVYLEKEEISLEEFKKDPLASNQILVNGIPIEKILGAKAGKSECCDVCAPYECRTIELSGEVYEVPSSEMIVKASMIAVRGLLGSCC